MGQQLSGILSVLGVLAVVYFPIQLYAVVKAGGIWRLMAALPLIIMGPLIVLNCMPGAHENGSLAALPLIFATPVAFVYLVIVSLSVSARAKAKCPHCGHVPKAKSFQLQVRVPDGPCPQCGK